MDKLKLNNQVIKMKIPIKKAIRKVYQKLKKNEEKFKNLNSKSKNEKKINKLEKQVKKCEYEKKILKTVTPEEIAKLALVLPCTNLKNLLTYEEISLEEKTKLKIVLTDIVQKLVENFHSELPGSEQWIDVTIDLIDIKKIIKSYKNKELIKKLDKQIKHRRNILKVYKLKNGIKDNENEVRNQNKLEIKKVIKRINLDKNKNEVFVDLNNLITETIESQEMEGIKIDDVQDNNILDIINAKLKNNESLEDNESIDSNEVSCKNLLQDKKNSDYNSEVDLDEEQLNDSDEEQLNDSDEEQLNDSDEEQLNDSNEEHTNDSDSDCDSIDSCKYDNFVNSNSNKNLELTENSDEEDIVLENLEDEELNENSSQKSDKVIELNDHAEDENKDEKDNDMKSESQKYLKNQLVKVFGEKLGKRKPTEDVSSDEEVVDDFFINKTVKKYKPTKADLVRYKDLKNKELSYKNRNKDNEEIDEFPKKQSEEEKLTKMKNSQKNLFNTQFSSESQPKKLKKNDINDNLHPSWEAKKKMKTNLKIDFNKTKNKKIIFD